MLSENIFVIDAPSLSLFMHYNGLSYSRIILSHLNQICIHALWFEVVHEDYSINKTFSLRWGFQSSHCTLDLSTERLCESRITHISGLHRRSVTKGLVEELELWTLPFFNFPLVSLYRYFISIRPKYFCQYFFLREKVREKCLIEGRC